MRKGLVKIVWCVENAPHADDTPIVAIDFRPNMPEKSSPIATIDFRPSKPEGMRSSSSISVGDGDDGGKHARLDRNVNVSPYQFGSVIADRIDVSKSQIALN
jgi:hypothetical protein